MIKFDLRLARGARNVGVVALPRKSFIALLVADLIGIGCLEGFYVPVSYDRKGQLHVNFSIFSLQIVCFNSNHSYLISVSFVGFRLGLI